jgi:hypothetical protein
MLNFSRISIGLTVAAALFAQTSNRKVTANNTQSPPADTSVTLGGKKITIEYNAPSARKRKVEGGLITYDRIWRLGADAATTLTTEGDIMIGDLRVPQGVHTLYLAATSDTDWKLAVNKQKGQWGTQYDQSMDLGRVPMKVTKLSTPVETLKITLKPAGGSAATLEIEWGASRGSVPVKIAS